MSLSLGSSVPGVSVIEELHGRLGHNIEASGLDVFFFLLAKLCLDGLLIAEGEDTRIPE